jgi:hypothetical protein
LGGVRRVSGIALNVAGPVFEADLVGVCVFGCSARAAIARSRYGRFALRALPAGGVGFAAMARNTTGEVGGLRVFIVRAL